MDNEYTRYFSCLDSVVNECIITKGRIFPFNFQPGGFFFWMILVPSFLSTYKNHTKNEEICSVDKKKNSVELKLLFHFCFSLQTGQYHEFFGIDFSFGSKQ